jgi:ribosomal protein L11 methyltransferase
VRVPVGRAEEARAAFLDLAPEGFEERETGGWVELAAYLEARRAAHVRERFPAARSQSVEPGWDDAWRGFHRPARVGRLWVGPPWEQPDPDRLAIAIDPGRAFGTGAHPTTRLALELLQELRPGSLVDLGCGSGVLAIAAAKLGFSPVVALDLDPAAVEATRANAAANAAGLTVRQADVLEDSIPAADVAVANLSLAAVVQVGPRLRAAHLVASGYLARERPEVAGWRPVDRRETDGWAADLFARGRD